MFIVSHLIMDNNDLDTIRVPSQTFQSREDAEKFAATICEDREPKVHTKEEWLNLPRNVDWDLV